jgi:integrase
MVKFTEPFVARVSPPEGARDAQFFDDALPGFGLRVFASGRKSYFVKFAIGRQQRKLALGPAAPGVLGDMRRKAADVLAKARLGDDVVAEKQKKIERHAATFSAVIDRYLAQKRAMLRRRSLIETERHLRVHWATFHAQPIDSMRRADVVARLDDLVESSGPVAADRAKAAISSLFNWAIERGYLDANPASGIKRRNGNGARTRVLSIDELRAVWRALVEDDYGRILKLLILTGQRRDEIGGLRWEEVDFDARLIRLPAERVKNKQPHDVWLSDPALAILAGCPRFEGHETVFGRNPHTGFSGWSKAKAALDERLGASVKPWTLHDLRRTFDTLCNEKLSLDPNHVDAVLNHVSAPAKAGVRRVYNLAQYAEQKRAALEAWGAHITQLVGASA